MRLDNRESNPVERAPTPMNQQIEELLSADAPSLDRVEATLTDGYAKALALEAERWRLERRLGEVARAGSDDLGAELTSLGSRLNAADVELSKLRSLLGTLHERARSLRRS